MRVLRRHREHVERAAAQLAARVDDGGAAAQEQLRDLGDVRLARGDERRGAVVRRLVGVGRGVEEQADAVRLPLERRDEEGEAPAAVGLFTIAPWRSNRAATRACPFWHAT